MIFISHASKDYTSVLPLVQFMETTGFKCWISERDLPSDKEDWAASIMDALGSSDIVFLYLTSNALQSGEVENEIANASSMKKNVIPYIAEKTILTQAFKYRLSKYQWIQAYLMEEKSARDILRKRILENSNAERDSFWNLKLTPAYRAFVRKVMLLYYGPSYFIHINDHDFPVFCIRGSSIPHATSISDYDILCDFDHSVLSDFSVDDHQTYKQLKWYKEYSHILEGKIRHPNRPGYMLDELVTDEDGLISKIRVHVGTYAENVYSNHVLEYELYRAFQEFSQEDLDDPDVQQRLFDFLELRNKMHSHAGGRNDAGFSKGMYESLLRGDARDSLLSVQMLVIMRSSRTHRYEAKLIQRSRDVAAEPGLYQFLPAGGFEILNDSDDDIYDDIELWDNFSPGCAVFREYLEELFNIPEFAGGGKGSIEDRLFKDPRIVEIEQMLRDGRAEFHFLGSVMGLSGLRQELSFALVIHDESYSEKQFIANEECKKGIVHSIPIEKFETARYRQIWDLLHGPSAAMWKLFRETPLYEKLTQ